MAYGTVKVDNITFTNGGSDQTVTVSGIVQSISGNITATGTIQGATIIGTSTVSGATVTGDSGQYGNLTAISGVYTTQLSGTTITGDTIQAFTVTGVSGVYTTQLSGATITGDTGNYSELTAISGVFTTQISGTTVTGDAGSFATVTGGVATITSGVFALGEEALPSISFSSDPDTGIYSPGADQVALSTNGTGRLFITNNRLRLNVASQFQITDSTSDSNGLQLLGSTSGDCLVGTLTNQSLVLRSNNTERLRISGGGRVQLPTTSQFQITDNADVTGLQFIGSSSAASTIGTMGAHDLLFRTNSSERLRITSAGLVGIGTSSPYQRLTLRGTNEQLLFDLNTTTNGTYASVAWNGATTDNGTGNYSAEIRGYREASGAYGALGFHTRGASGTSQERARIDSSGRLLVGTSSAVGAGSVGELLQVGFSGGSRAILANTSTSLASGALLGQIDFTTNVGSSISTGASIKANCDGTAAAGDAPTRLVFSSNPGAPATGPAEAMRINSAQELLIGYTSDNGAYKLQVNSQIFATSAIIATSDGRYKENVATLDGCVDLVKALRPVSFDWKAQQPITRVDEDGETVVVREAHNFPDGKQVGFIAQEVEEVLADKPWLGSVIKQNVRPAVTDADGNELAPEEEFLGIAEGNLVAVLTSALKDAIAKIETLEAKVAALESA